MTLMTYNPIINLAEQSQFPPEKRERRWLILSLLFVTALAIRLYGINEYPLDSHPVKQYRSALTARAYYYEHATSIPEWKKETALQNLHLLGSLGPTVVEHIASFAFRITGAETLWIPRFFSSLAWLVGGIFIYLIALELSSFEAAIVSTAFFLFLPTSILFSQSFQPDPMMVMLMVMGLYAIIQHYQTPTKRRLLVAAAISGVAIVVKPVSLFFIFGAFAALSIDRHGIRGLILNPSSWAFSVVSLLPTILFYGYGVFISGALTRQADTSFIPSLLLELYFWQFWLKHIYRVIGFAALVGAMLGILLFPAGWRRLLIIGLWVSYILYGTVFTYHIHTHDYYQLPFVPVIALSLGPLGALLFRNLYGLNSHWSGRVAVFSVFLFSIGLNIGLFVQMRHDMPDFEREVRLAEEIGEIVGHSTQTLILAPYSGSPLKYHGQIAGWPWPTKGDINAERLAGEPELSVDARFSELKEIHEPDYFIVTDFNEFSAQEDLREFLSTSYPVFLQNDNCIIFELNGQL
jgi:4-amino-4-deoxy-L-arabinose transferase-like glycosyltransferase